MVLEPSTSLKSLNDEQMRQYLESLENGAPGDMKAVMEAAWGTLSDAEGEDLIQWVQQSRDRSILDQ